MEKAPKNKMIEHSPEKKAQPKAERQRKFHFVGRGTVSATSYQEALKLINK